MKLRFCLIPLVATFALSNALACTLWAATGAGYTKDGTTLVAKVRDFTPMRQVVKTVRDGKGFAFHGLFVGKKEFFNSGINERGLFVASSTAGSIPKKERTAVRFAKTPEGWGALETIARTCATVDEAIAHVQAISNGHPVNFVIADRESIAMVECLPNAKVTVKKTKRGVLAHTNHYIESESVIFNQRVGESSLARYARIQELLRTTARPYTLGDFVTMSNDQSNGVDKSIFRVGASPELGRTLATIIYAIPKAGPVQYRIYYQANPGQAGDPWVKSEGTFN